MRVGAPVRGIAALILAQRCINMQAIRLTANCSRSGGAAIVLITPPAPNAGQQ